ncbi:MAG: glycogen debranching enzyme family protein [Acidobacteria bacterium]|nr:glycogen debranching enzyme family protein [Acidobacteriota bacterium]MBS1865322.1 glycogen debranching enzyme family protein [Acidobacteriota bacterium]
MKFDRGICNDFSAASSREWLVTNGIGGYASGTVAGCSTRRYHGILLAALKPPVGRTQLVGALDEAINCTGTCYELSAHEWASGALAPQGFRFIESFHLEGTIPTWVYALGDARLQKQIWMRQGENTTYIRYTLLATSSPIQFQAKALVNYRDFHGSTHAGDWRMRVEPVAHGVRVIAYDGAVPFYLKSVEASALPQHIWYHDCFFRLERERGLDDHEDHLFTGQFSASLEAGNSLTFVFTTKEGAILDGEFALAEQKSREAGLLDLAAKSFAAADADSFAGLPGQLILAADQFNVHRPLPNDPHGHSIIAGYHWFGDWGRDTMISLPGLLLTSGRTDLARDILLAFAQFVDGGMLPNNFPDSGGPPEYNTIDAALWYFEATRQYIEETHDLRALKELFPILNGIIEAHVAGTRYNIHADPEDGLLYGGGPGVQLTWMDAKVGDWVVTPRTGKPVEINALWINALETTAQFARTLRLPATRFETLAAVAKSSFQKFWNQDHNCLYDVIDSPGIGNDASLRPNQILAVSLPVSPLTQEQQESVVNVCERELLTPVGLRSLCRLDSRYVAHYCGGPRERDAAYHQGTVWGWLLGPFALAHFRVYQDKSQARRFLESQAKAISSYGLGTLAEIYDADAPYKPTGCIAQAWTVAELLRAWKLLS